jgi:hypothetical protein
MMGHKKKYLKFLAMILLSMLVMYGITYLNCVEARDVRWSETRLFMNLMMGSAMAIIMLIFMRGMYNDKKMNLGIYAFSAAVFISSFLLVRSQATIHDLAYLRGMIPHHSIAILTSNNSNIRDQRVRELADHISETQRREIGEMTWLVEDIQANGPALTPADAKERKYPGQNNQNVGQM